VGRLGAGLSASLSHLPVGKEKGVVPFQTPPRLGDGFGLKGFTLPRLASGTHPIFPVPRSFRRRIWRVTDFVTDVTIVCGGRKDVKRYRSSRACAGDIRPRTPAHTRVDR
jgi:hypothetical protein